MRQNPLPSTGTKGALKSELMSQAAQTAPEELFEGHFILLFVIYIRSIMAGHIQLGTNKKLFQHHHTPSHSTS